MDVKERKAKEKQLAELRAERDRFSQETDRALKTKNDKIIALEIELGTRLPKGVTDGGV